MAERTFGWIQEACALSNLKKVIGVFVPNSDINVMLRTDKIPRLIDENYGRQEMIDYLSQENMKIPYSLLKGKGISKGVTRGNAPCSGIIQAALPGQKKEYQSDWPADSFLRWGVSIGFLCYDRDSDCCSISEMGLKYANAPENSKDEEEVLTQAFLSYPPVCRVLHLLDKLGHLTKFEIGNQLGFIGEAGFTSIPQHLILQGLDQAEDEKERTILLRDTEGTSDKYARTICSWLKAMKWVCQIPKEVTVSCLGKKCSDTIPQAYQITLKGKKVLKYTVGTSKFKRIPKRVIWDMLATKPSDRNYLRNRRTYLIQYLVGKDRKLSEIVSFLEEKNIKEEQETILDDIKGLENIGLEVKKTGSCYKIMDSVIGLEIPSAIKSILLAKSNLTLLKNSIRKKLTCIDHKYLLLIDLGFDGKSDRDYEIQTAELLTTELGLKGARLGGSRKPDVCVYSDDNGLILDNKAYGKGYSLPIKQADEMVRYLEENKTRNIAANPNSWWKIFDATVKNYRFAFVSGEFTGGFQDRLNNIYVRSGLNGAAINSVNLLLLAQELKSGRMDFDTFFSLFDCNKEITEEAWNTCV